MTFQLKAGSKNCGVRLLRTNLTEGQVRPKLKQLLEEIFRSVPSGIGRGGKIRLSTSQLDEVLELGAKWAVERGYGTERDLEFLEENGQMKQADSSKVSSKAKKRGAPQLGTLGAGNHFLEIQKVDKIYLPEVAKVFGLEEEGQVCVMIHCLPPNSKIMTEFGYYLPIKDFNKKKNLRVFTFEKSQNSLVKANIEKFWKFVNNKKIVRIKTLTDREIICTEDHPIFTSSGWKLAKDIKRGDLVLTFPFEGVEYEEPKKDKIIDETDLKKVGGSKRIIRRLKKNGLLPLKFNSEKIGIVARLVGYAFGDVWVGGKRPTVKFSDKLEVLLEIKKDLEKLGYSSFIVRVKKHRIFGEGYQLVVTSPSFALFLKALGVPWGKTTDIKFDVPAWIKQSPKWIKRLFLAGYFTAEMCVGELRKGEEYRTGHFFVSMNKVEDLLEDGIKFMKSIQSLLREFEIESHMIVFPHVRRRDGKISYKILLKLSSKLENLIKFASKVGCEYDLSKFSKLMRCLHYYRYKMKMSELEAKMSGKSFESVLVPPHKLKQIRLLSFEEFVRNYTAGDLVMWDEVEEVKEDEQIEEVFDLTIAHPAHNFVADGFVVSNTGSRGFGHQVCTDYLRILEHAFRDELRKLPDRELVFAPAGTKQCDDYFGAMCCAANFAWCNRQMITHWVRESMVKALGVKKEDIGLEVVYDVAHNIGKIEIHEIDGEKKKVYVHRKGATRAFPAGSKEIPKEYMDVGQPVLIPGAMASASYVLVAGKGSKDTFYSTAHGAGRVLSRTKALKIFRGEKVAREMERSGILVRAASWKVLAEEATQVYKEIDEVALVTEKAGISNRVIRLVPIGVVKG